MIELNDYFEEVYEVIVPYSAYVNPNKKGLLSPSPELLELLVWNVVIAFIVNIAASVGYGMIENLRRRSKRHLQSKVEIDETLQILHSIDLSALSKENLDDGISQAEKDIAKILKDHSFPENKIKVSIIELKKVTIGRFTLE